MGIGVLCRNYCRTSNPMIAYDRKWGKYPAVEEGLGAVGPVLLPAARLVRADSAVLVKLGGGRAFL
jgi:hypothetical protein